MSIRYTLILATSGDEVWRRWTGDREEALRDLAVTMVDLDIGHHRALSFVELLRQKLDTSIGPFGIAILTDDLRSSLTFEVRHKGSGSDHAVST